jgi:predicted O-methyltransferase YrrM
MSVVTHFLLWSLRIAPAETQTTAAERKALASRAHGTRTVVEIGVWHGVTTSLLRSAMAEEGVLYAVDPFFPGRLGINFQQIIAHTEVGRVSRGVVRWIRSCDALAVQHAQDVGLEAVDFIFIDGDHGYEGLQRDWEYLVVARR